MLKLCKVAQKDPRKNKPYENASVQLYLSYTREKTKHTSLTRVVYTW